MAVIFASSEDIVAGIAELFAFDDYFFEASRQGEDSGSCTLDVYCFGIHILPPERGNFADFESASVHESYQ